MGVLYEITMDGRRACEDVAVWALAAPLGGHAGYATRQLAEERAAKLRESVRWASAIEVVPVYEHEGVCDRLFEFTFLAWSVRDLIWKGPATIRRAGADAEGARRALLADFGGVRITAVREIRDHAGKDRESDA